MNQQGDGRGATGSTGGGIVSALSSQYAPAEHEGAVRARWEASGAFHADAGRVVRGEAPGYCVLIPPPNVTAQLHLGHALNNTLQDVLVRAKRMQGFEALWMPGTDHAGIATQAVVEKRLRAEGKLRGPLKGAMARDEFIGQVQAWKDEYEAVITNQLKMMGCSCDWARQRFTMDPQCARAVYEAFYRLFLDGLIYRGKRLVNWDPLLQTAVADDECYDEEIDGNFYYLRYPLVSRRVLDEAGQKFEAVPVTWGELRRRGWNQLEDAAHADDLAAWVTVATTRPETYLGDTAVAVSPHDPRATALRGLYAQLPLVGRVVPIVEDDYVVLPERLARSDEEKADPKAKMATGFLKVTPAHDPNDEQIGLRHRLAVINIFGPDASVSDKHGWSDVGDAHVFVGKKREEARKLVVMEFKARGLHEATRPHRHSVKHSDRSKAIVEPYLSDQWYVRVTDPRLAQAANEALATDVQTVGRVVVDSSRGAGFQPAQLSVGSEAALVDKSMLRAERRLPHWQRGGSTYFVTYRTLDGALGDTERQVVIDAWKHFDGERYEAHAVVVMPDHVHVLVSPYVKSEGVWHSISEILDSIKRHSALVINQARGQQGQLWQDESFDHIIRNSDDYFEKLRYIIENPVAAGLCGPRESYRHLTVTDEARQGRLRAPERVRGGAVTGGQVGNLPHAELGNLPHATIPSSQTTAQTDRITFHPARYAKTYQHWHEGIRDWCISRQLWWGHQVPVWTHATGEHAAAELHALRELEMAGRVRLDLQPVMGADVFGGTSGERKHRVCVRNPGDAEAVAVIERAGFVRDPDVLDTWFSSALWPLSTLGWPENTQELAAFNPSSTLCTAREIITLWVSRMVMFNRYLYGAGGGKGPVPFTDVVIHAVIQDGEGRKMSKSLGNGIDPLDIIATHGSDAMRFTLCALATQTQDVRMPVQKDAKSGRNSSAKFDQGRNFCNKLWNACRFAISKLPAAGPEGAAVDIDPAALSIVDRWMLGRVHAAVVAIDRAIGEYQFADYATALYDLVWRDFCDWYLEAIKPTVEKSPAQQGVLAAVIDVILRLAHPAMPYVTEAIFEHTRQLGVRARLAGLELGEPRRAGLLCTAPWPQVGPELVDERASAAFERLRTLVEQVREVRASQQIKPQHKVTLHAPAALRAELAAPGPLVMALAGLAAVEVLAGELPAGAIKLRLLGEDCAISGLVSASALGGGVGSGVDAAAHAAASAELAAKRAGDLRKQHATIAARLANPGYAQRAPAKLVEESKAQLLALEDELKSMGMTL